MSCCVAKEAGESPCTVAVVAPSLEVGTTPVLMASTPASGEVVARATADAFGTPTLAAPL